MTKIVYNACYGGFGLSHEAVLRYAEIKGIKLYFDKQYSTYSYYLVPVDEYNRIRAGEQAKPVGSGRFKESNDAYFSVCSIERTDPILVQVVEELGERANGDYARLRIADIPAGTLYRIDEYDGYESVKTRETYDWSVA